MIIAAGVRAAGEGRVSAALAAEYAFRIGRDLLRKPISVFLRALVDGGQLREEDLKNAGSSNGSTQETAASELFEELVTRSEGTSA